MSENLTIYEKAPTTARSADKLARRHGFENLAELAESLPAKANVLDIGAGASPFGREVAALRPDISWTNVDYSYRDPAILAEASHEAPDNLRFVAGDATQLETLCEPESADAVFSYWLMPHLSLEEDAPALAAAKQMHMVAKPGAFLSVGPRFRQLHDKSLHSPATYRAVKDETLTHADEFAAAVVEATRLTGLTRRAQTLHNEVVTPYFGTSRNRRRDNGARVVLEPQTGEYVKMRSRRGMKTVGGLAVAVARHLIDSRSGADQGDES